MRFKNVRMKDSRKPEEQAVVLIVRRQLATANLSPLCYFFLLRLLDGGS